MKKYLTPSLAAFSLILSTILAVSNVNAQAGRRKGSTSPRSNVSSKPAPPPSRSADIKRILLDRKSLDLPAGDPCLNAAPIAIGQTIMGTLQAGDCALNDGTLIDFYDLQGTAGQAVFISLTSGTFDTYLYLFDDAGNTIDENDDSGNSTDSRIPIDGGVITLPYTGHFYLGANSYDPSTGPYSISVTTPAECAPTVILYNQPVNGVLANSDCAVNLGGDLYYTDLFIFPGKAGQQISVAMSSTAIDSYLILHTPSGNGTIEDDDSGGGLNSRIPATGTLTLPETGLYTIEASSSGVGEVGSYMLNLAGTANHGQSDFDGDGKSDIAVWRETEGVWYLLNSSNSTFSAFQFGTTGDKIVPGDYDGDGKTDFAVYRPSNGTWYMKESTAGYLGMQFGLGTDLPVQGDFDGDGKTDIAVFRPSEGTWYLFQSTAGFVATQFGTNGDKPVVGDYDGDGKSDIAVFRPSDGVWYQLRSSQGFAGVQFGISTDKVVAGDFDGDGKTDQAVYRDGGSGIWYLLQSSAGFNAVSFGTTGDIPTPGDFDGDGNSDIGVFRPSSGIWYLQQSTSGFAAAQFGQNGDKPVESGYVPMQ